MRNPNGYGSVFKLSGNRRRPYAVRKTIGFNEKGQPIYRFIGYTKTRQEGMIMLSEYNKSPYSFENKDITANTLFERYLTLQSDRMSKALRSSLKAAWRHCGSVRDVPYAQLNSLMIQNCIDSCERGASTKASIKNLFNHLDRFALELDIITRKRCLIVSTPAIPETSRQPFSEEEIALLWENRDIPCADAALIYIYTGMRLNELLTLRRENVNVQSGIIKGGSKTAAGKDRTIPIHPDIMPLIEARLAEGAETLLSYNGKPYTRSRFYSEWGKLMTSLDVRHTPHECRHTFRSLLDSAGANKRCIDLIMGHKSRDVGERVYTHKTIKELKQAVMLIDVKK